MNEEEKQKIDNDNFIAILLFSSLFIIIYAIYLIPILRYIFKNCLKNKICVYWIDYTILIFSGIMFIIIYIINLALFKLERKKERINNIIELSSNIYSTLIIVFLTIMCVTIINSLFFDSIIACKLSYIMNKIKKIEEKNFIILSEKLKEANVINILKFRFTFFYNVIFFIVDIIYIVLVILTYKDTNPIRFKGYLNLNSYITILLRYYHLAISFLLIISIIIMNKNKKSLLKKHYYNYNRLAQKLFDIYFNQIIYFTDIISFKLVSDLIMNIPAFLFLSKKKLDTASLIISEFAIFIYIFFGGSEYLIIDKTSKATKLNKKIKNLFCLKYLDFHFGQKDHSHILDQFKFNYPKEEKNVFKNLNMTLINNIEKNLLDLDEKENININNFDEEIEFNESSEYFFNNNSKKLEFKTISEFYLIQKLMMLYFKENKNIYELHSDINYENNFGFSFNNLFKKQNKGNKILNTQEKNNFISNIEKISRISILDSKKIKSCLKFTSDIIFCSVEEKELYEEIKNQFHINNKIINFKIENLFLSELFELFPFYQMNINSIIASLEPSRNIKLFKKFVNKKLKNNKLKENINRFSVKNNYNENNNINNKINEEFIEEKNKIDYNIYYTNDLYLMYEIFEIDEFFKYDEIKSIILEYNKYLLSLVKNMNYSFLPSILGIFYIEIESLNSRNIIILYRNPLYFTNFNNFNHWISFYLTETSQKIKVSNLLKDIIDINEIEVNNTLQLNENDYDEIKLVLKNDFSFLKKLKNIFPIVYIFIGEESNNENIKKKKNSDNSPSNDSINNKNLIEILDKNLSMSSIDNSNIISNSGNSLFEKEYYYLNGNSLRTVKIYFADLFRDKSKLNKQNIDNYYENMMDKIIKYLSKNSLINEEKR